MKLEKFKEKNKKKKFIITFTISCILLLAGVFLYTSFAVFTEEKDFNVINGTAQILEIFILHIMLTAKLLESCQAKIVVIFLMQNKVIARMESYLHGTILLGHFKEIILTIQKRIIQEPNVICILQKQKQCPQC